MAFPLPLRRLSPAALAVLAAALSGTALYLGAGLHPVAWLVWLAPIPVIWAAPRLRALTAFAVAAAAWATGILSQLSYLRRLLPVPVIVLAIAMPALVFGLAVALSRAFALRGAAMRAALALPVVWVSYELVQAHTASFGTFASLAYTQTDALLVLQLASLFGIWGVTFTVLFLPAAAAVACIGAIPRARRLRLLAVAGGVAAVTLGFGLWRLRAVPSSEPMITVGLAASDLGAHQAPAHAGASGRRVLDDYLQQAAALAGRGARVVVLPEMLAELDGPAAAAIDPAFQGLVNRSNMTLVVGVVRTEGGARFNEARVYQGGSPAPLAYHKRHLLPGFESRVTPGSDRLIVNTPGGPLGLAICKDMDFPDTGRRYRADDISLMLVPAWDFTVDAWWHARMAVVRGVESGFGVVRSAKRGLLTVSDDRGRILAEQSSGAAAFSTVLATAPTRHTATLYARIGDAFGWAALPTLAALLVSLLGRRAAAGGETSPDGDADAAVGQFTR